MREIIATITSKGQVTIPSEVRCHLGVSKQGKVAFVIGEEGKVELRPARYTVADLRGILPPLPERYSDDLDDLIDEAFEEGVDRMLES
jgi:AbrB family looped-hinge helix DNA binding protein